MDAVMGIDLGTSYFKVAVVSRQGAMLGLGRRPVPVRSPQPAYRELSVAAFIDTLRQAISDAFTCAGIDPHHVTAVSYSSQANTFALFDDSMQPLTPLIVWSDSRVSSFTPEVRRFAALPDLLERTGLGLFNIQMCIAKLGWLRRREPHIWAATRYVVTISDFLLYLFTGSLSGDSSTASLLGIWDLIDDCYWERGLQTLDLRPELFAPLQRTATTVGNATGDLAQQIGLPDSAVVVAGSLDHAAAAVGAGIGYLGQASESTGTVLAALGLVGQVVAEEGASVGPFAGLGCFYKVAFSEYGAGVLEWYQRHYAPQLTLTQLTALAEEVVPGSDGLIARPDAHRYPELNGFVAPPSRCYRHGHYVRALMERLAAELRSLLLSVLDGVPPSAVVATGGGAQNDLWLQIKADVIGHDFLRTDSAEPGAMGAAMYAACGAGWFASVQEAGRAWLSITSRFSPDPARSRQYQYLREPL